MFPQTEVGRSADSAGVTHWGAGLPEALLGALLSHLDAPTLLRVARHVCREWRGACTEVLAQLREGESAAAHLLALRTLAVAMANPKP